MYETWFFLDCVLVSCYLRDVCNIRNISQGALCVVFGRPIEATVVAAMQSHGFAFPFGELSARKVRDRLDIAASLHFRQRCSRVPGPDGDARTGDRRVSNLAAGSLHFGLRSRKRNRQVHGHDPRRAPGIRRHFLCLALGCKRPFYHPPTMELKSAFVTAVTSFLGSLVSRLVRVIQSLPSSRS